MKRTSKLLSLLLAALMLASSLAACSGGDDPADTTGSGDSADTTTVPEETTADPLADPFPDVTYDGYNFRLYGAISDTVVFSTIYREEEKGETVNDAVFNRNKAVEERFKIKITHVQSAGDVYSLYKDTITNVASGDDFADLVCGETLNQVYLQNALFNLKEIKSFDFDRVWWLPAAESQTVNNKLYTVQSAISYNILAYARVIFMNTDLAKANNIEVPYDKVREGKWTLDEWINMTKDFYKDVNGDGQRDPGDIYGMVMTGTQYATIECFGVESVIMNDQGTALVDNVMSPEFLSYVEKTCQWLYGGNVGFQWQNKSGNGWSTGNQFKAGTLLTVLNFMQNMINLAPEFGFDYTILPVPKLDENQENYRAGSTGNNFAMPTTVKNPERDGYIIEEMSRLGYRDVYPAYKDLALRGRYSTNQDCADMVDIFADSAWVSFAYMNFLGGDNPQAFYLQVWGDRSPTPAAASKYEAKKSIYQKGIDQMNAHYFGTGK